MSVMLVDNLKGYGKLSESIRNFRIKESKYIQRRTLYIEEIITSLYSLYLLNIETYNNKYNESILPYKQSFFASEVIKVNEKYYCVEQLLRSLRFLKYQIEEEYCKPNQEEKQTLKWLNSLIEDVQEYLLLEYTLYSATSWSL